MMVYGVLESSSDESHVGNYYYNEHTTVHAREDIMRMGYGNGRKRKKPTHFFCLTRYVRLRSKQLTSGIPNGIRTRFLPIDRPNASRKARALRFGADVLRGCRCDLLFKCSPITAVVVSSPTERKFPFASAVTIGDIHV